MDDFEFDFGELGAVDPVREKAIQDAIEEEIRNRKYLLQKFTLTIIPEDLECDARDYRHCAVATAARRMFKEHGFEFDDVWVSFGGGSYFVTIKILSSKTTHFAYRSSHNFGYVFSLDDRNREVELTFCSLAEGEHLKRLLRIK